MLWVWLMTDCWLGQVRAEDVALWRKKPGPWDALLPVASLGGGSLSRERAKIIKTPKHRQIKPLCAVSVFKN